MVDMVSPMFGALGIKSEDIEQTENSITFRVPRCPFYEGCQQAGAPAEEFCKYMAEPLMNGIMKQIWRLKVIQTHTGKLYFITLDPMSIM